MSATIPPEELSTQEQYNDLLFIFPDLKSSMDSVHKEYSDCLPIFAANPEVAEGENITTAVNFPNGALYGLLFRADAEGPDFRFNYFVEPEGTISAVDGDTSIGITAAVACMSTKPPVARTLATTTVPKAIESPGLSTDSGTQFDPTIPIFVSLALFAGYKIGSRHERKIQDSAKTNSQDISESDVQEFVIEV